MEHGNFKRPITNVPNFLESYFYSAKENLFFIILCSKLKPPNFLKYRIQVQKYSHSQKVIPNGNAFLLCRY